MRFWWVAVVGIVLLCANGGLAQDCKARCSTVLTTCNNLNYYMYMPNTTNVTTTESAAASVVAAANSSLSALCRTKLQQLTCSLSFPACNNNTGAQIRPCKTQCTDFKAACGSYIPNFPSALQPYLDCDATDGVNPLYADSACPYVNVTTNQCTLTQAAVGFCVKWNITQAPYTGELCNPYVGEEIHVRANISLADKAIYDAAIFMIKAYNPIIPLGCYKTLMSYICGNAFPGCQRLPVPQYNAVAQLPIKPCYSVCHAREDLCDEFFVALNITLANCSAVLPGPVIPTAMRTSDGKTLMLDGTCRDTTFPANASGVFSFPPFAECPSVLGRKSNPKEENNDPRCWIKCPDASYTDDEWATLVTLIKIGASLSFVATAFMLISYLVNFDKRKFPLNVHMWQFVACLCLAITFLLNGSNPQKDVWCTDPATFANQSNSNICGAQGFLFIFFGLSVATWCLVIAFIMFRAIVFKIRVQDLDNKMVFFHIFGWGVPLVFAITAAAKDMIGYGTPLAWCFIQFKGFGFGTEDTEKISIDYALFYIPIGILFFINLLFFTVTVAKIVHVRRLQVSKNPGKSPLKSRTLQAQIRVMLFIFVVIIICFTIFEWRFQIESGNSRHEYDAVGFAWVVCKIKVAVNFFASTGYCPTDTPPSRINYPHTAAESFLISSIGFLMACAFATDLGIYRHWSKLFMLASSGEWFQLKEFVLWGKDPFEGSKKSKSKTTDSSNASSSVKRSDGDSSGDRGGMPLTDFSAQSGTTVDSGINV